MPELTFLTNLCEMIAAFSALGVTFILYLETRRMREEIRKDRSELLKMQDKLIVLLTRQ